MRKMQSAGPRPHRNKLQEEVPAVLLWYNLPERSRAAPGGENGKESMACLCAGGATGKMKKITAVLLAVLLAFALCACGGSAPAEEEETGSAHLVEKMPAFQTIDLEGNEVDESIFAGADITVINFWGTFCPPCIEEMPELAEWDGQLPDNVQIIGVIIDAASEDSEEFEAAKQLVADSGVGYTNIIAGDGFPMEVLDQLAGVPTTIFVDAEGNCIAPDVFGADVAAYKQTVEDLL